MPFDPRYDDKNHMDPRFRTPLGHETRMKEEALRKAQIQRRRDLVEEMQIAGHSQSAIARTLNVSRMTVSRDLEALQQERITGNISSLADRLQTSLARRYRTLQYLMGIVGDTKAYNKDRIAAAETFQKVQDTIDTLEGTVAPEKVNSSALAEMYNLFVRIVAQANPEQQQLYQELLRQELAGNPIGAALLGSADAYHYDAGQAEDDEEEQDEDEVTTVEADSGNDFTEQSAQSEPQDDSPF